jgi:DNA-binding transcriptional ArsR family regulator
MGIVLAENVHIYNSWLPGNDGIDSLDAWLTANPARLVTIDTLSRWQDDFHGSDIWARDTKRIADLKAIADLHDCTVLIVHHRSKASREDIHQSVAGTNALQGAADGSIILDKKRNENTGKLSIIGRDIPEGELAIEFMPDTCSWRALDIDPAELALNAERRAILEAIRELGGTAKPGQIAERLGKDRSNVSHILRKLTDEGTIASSGYGTYTTVKPYHTEHTIHTSQGEHEETVNSVNTVSGIQGEEELEIY